MTDEEMHAVLDGLAVGDKVHAWLTGCRPADYTVKTIKGGRDRCTTIEGARGAVFVLAGGEHGIWARPAKRGAKPRKVRELVLASAKRLEIAKADADFAARRMPSGYSIHTWEGSDGIWHQAMVGSESVPRGLMKFGYSDPADAVIDAWAHYCDSQVKEHAKTIDALALSRDETDAARAELTRCRKALRQISEIVFGVAKSCKSIPDDYPPEQVVADVAHAKVLASSIDSSWKVGA